MYRKIQEAKQAYPVTRKIRDITWPAPIEGDRSHGWVISHGPEASDHIQAATNLLAELHKNLNWQESVVFGLDYPEGCDDLYPYIDIGKIRSVYARSLK